MRGCRGARPWRRQAHGGGIGAMWCAEELCGAQTKAEAAAFEAAKSGLLCSGAARCVSKVLDGPQADVEAVLHKKALKVSRRTRKIRIGGRTHWRCYCYSRSKARIQRSSKLSIGDLRIRIRECLNMCKSPLLPRHKTCETLVLHLRVTACHHVHSKGFSEE